MEQIFKHLNKFLSFSLSNYDLRVVQNTLIVTLKEAELQEVEMYAIKLVLFRILLSYL